VGTRRKGLWGALKKEFLLTKKERDLVLSEGGRRATGKKRRPGGREASLYSPALGLKRGRIFFWMDRGGKAGRPRGKLGECFRHERKRETP